MAGWQDDIGGRLAEFAAEGHLLAGAKMDGDARMILEWVRADGSRGVHNYELSDSLLSAASELIE
jgi:hypothetical protein